MHKKNNKTILIVDDEANVRLVLQDLLEHEGYRVETARSGELALKIVQEIDPDIILLDMAMPGMGGVGFLASIANANGDPIYPVLVLTARTNMKEFFQTVSVDGFLAKPCDHAELLSEIKRIIGQRETRPKPQDATERPHRVLVAGGHQAFVDKIVEELKRKSCEVDFRLSGADAIERAVIWKPNAIIVEQIMPGMNGTEVTSLLRVMSTLRDTIIVVFDSTRSEKESVRFSFCKPRDVDAYLFQPTEIEVVEQTLKLLKQHRGNSSAAHKDDRAARA